MQTATPATEASQLGQLLAGELEKLKARIAELERDLARLRASEVVAQARARQADAEWLKKLREQYSAEVCRETLEANQSFPVAAE